MASKDESAVACLRSAEGIHKDVLVSKGEIQTATKRFLADKKKLPIHIRNALMAPSNMNSSQYKELCRTVCNEYASPLHYMLLLNGCSTALKPSISAATRRATVKTLWENFDCKYVTGDVVMGLVDVYSKYGSIEDLSNILNKLQVRDKSPNVLSDQLAMCTVASSALQKKDIQEASRIFASFYKETGVFNVVLGRSILNSLPAFNKIKTTAPNVLAIAKAALSNNVGSSLEMKSIISLLKLCGMSTNTSELALSEKLLALAMKRAGSASGEELFSCYALAIKNILSSAVISWKKVKKSVCIYRDALEYVHAGGYDLKAANEQICSDFLSELYCSGEILKIQRTLYQLKEFNELDFDAVFDNFSRKCKLNETEKRALLVVGRFRRVGSGRQDGLCKEFDAILKDKNLDREILWTFRLQELIQSQRKYLLIDFLPRLETELEKCLSDNVSTQTVAAIANLGFAHSCNYIPFSRNSMMNLFNFFSSKGDLENMKRVVSFMFSLSIGWGGKKSLKPSENTIQFVLEACLAHADYSGFFEMFWGYLSCLPGMGSHHIDLLVLKVAQKLQLQNEADYFRIFQMAIGNGLKPKNSADWWKMYNSIDFSSASERVVYKLLENALRDESLVEECILELYCETLKLKEGHVLRSQKAVRKAMQKENQIFMKLVTSMDSHRVSPKDWPLELIDEPFISKEEAVRVVDTCRLANAYPHIVQLMISPKCPPWDQQTMKYVCDRVLSNRSTGNVSNDFSFLRKWGLVHVNEFSDRTRKEQYIPAAPDGGFQVSVILKNVGVYRYGFDFNHILDLSLLATPSEDIDLIYKCKMHNDLRLSSWLALEGLNGFNYFANETFMEAFKSQLANGLVSPSVLVKTLDHLLSSSKHSKLGNDLVEAIPSCYSGLYEKAVLPHAPKVCLQKVQTICEAVSDFDSLHASLLETLSSPVDDTKMQSFFSKWNSTISRSDCLVSACLKTIADVERRRGYNRTACFDVAKWLLSRFHEDNFSPDNCVVPWLIEKPSLLKDVKLNVRFLSMESMYAVLDACRQSNSLMMYMDIVKQMKVLGIKPPPFVYSACFDELSSGRNYRRGAWSRRLHYFLDEAVNDGVPNSVVNKYF
eukprot:Nk52_evm22s2209 gene=Nk52_evmTU22s2209